VLGVGVGAFVGAGVGGAVSDGTLTILARATIVNISILLRVIELR
jgi:hypothetical protein